MKKAFRKIHLWLAVPVGLVFLMMCITGAIMVFEDEITASHYSDLRKIEPEKTALTVDSIKALLVESGAVEGEIRSVIPSNSFDEAYKVVMAKPKGAAYYVNQYTGRVVAPCPRLTFFSKTQALHRWILDAPKDGKSVGKSIIGWCTIAAFIIVISGLVIWWPSTSRMLKARLSIKTKSASVFWYTLHAAGGFYITLILLVIILTGLTWSFGWWKDVMTGIFGDVSFKPVHTGAWLGIISKIVWFISALIGAALPLTGYYIWLRKPKSQKPKA